MFSNILGNDSVRVQAIMALPTELLIRYSIGKRAKMAAITNPRKKREAVMVTRLNIIWAV